MPNFERVNPTNTQEVTFWKPTTVGDAVEGVYTKRIGGIHTQFGEIDAIHITDAQGVVWQLLLTAGLVRAIDCVSIGELIRVEYNGMAYNKATKRRNHDYIVYRDTGEGELPF